MYQVSIIHKVKQRVFLWDLMLYTNAGPPDSYSLSLNITRCIGLEGMGPDKCIYVVVSKSFQPDQHFKVREIK